MWLTTNVGKKVVFGVKSVSGFVYSLLRNVDRD